MKDFLIISFIAMLAVVISCKQDEVQPSNYISVTIEDTEYRFIGGSIYEPKNLFKDTLRNTIYLGGFIGTCVEGSDQFIDIQLNQTSEGTYSLNEGLQFWMQTDNHHLFIDSKSSDLAFSLTITDFGEVDGIVSGTFSGGNTSNDQSNFTGTFSLQRLPDYSATLEVASVLCK